jgi:hypothetical protein
MMISPIRSMLTWVIQIQFKMQNATIINKFGTMIGWNNISVPLLGRVLEGFSRIKYNDTVEKKNAKGAGAYAIGREHGNYDAECEIDLFKEEILGLQKSLAPGRRIQDIPPFDIPVIYENLDGIITTDIIRNAEFTDNGVDVKNGDGSISTSYKLIVSHIDWNVF